MAFRDALVFSILSPLSSGAGVMKMNLIFIFLECGFEGLRGVQYVF